MSRIASLPSASPCRLLPSPVPCSGPAVPTFGFSREKIHFQVLLERDGSLSDLQDIRDTNERGKKIPSLKKVPDGGGRSGTTIKPFFCWDNTGYALGADNKANPGRALKMFAAFRDLHLAQRTEVGGDEGFEALCSFLQRWDPTSANSLPDWEEAAGKNVVFKLRGRDEFVHQSEAVRGWWVHHLSKSADADRTRGISLVSGEEEDLARLHPLISGVAKANTTGAAIVSFNEDAYTSYGRTQSYNAPVGVYDAFRYTTALSSLLLDDQRKVRIGDATVVFWTDRAEARDAEEVFAAFFTEGAAKGDPAESGRLVDRLHAFLRRGEARTVAGSDQ